MTGLFELTLAALSWEPEIRGVTAVLIGFVVLVGSVYLLLATNTGVRTGLLLAVTGLFGWMSIMGVLWWVYGIGWKGPDPSWHALEVNYGDITAVEHEAVAEDPTLADWEEVEPGSTDFGELQATTLEVLTLETDPPAFESADQIYVLEMFETGGKPERASDSVIDRVTNRVTNTLRIMHPPKYAVVFVQGTLDVEPPGPGEAPPIPEPDPEKPVVALVLERDLGSKRLNPAMLTIFSLTVFGIGAHTLHRRDKLQAENRARTEPLEV